MTKLAFMSTTAPIWNVRELIDGAGRLGYEGVDVRVEWGHAHGLELDSTQDARREARQYAADKGIAWSCVALSTRFARATDAEQQDAVEQVKRYAELARDLGSPLLRVFGGNIPDGHTMAELRPRTAAYLGRAAEAAAQWGVTPCLEVHDQHNNPEDVAWIVENAAHANVGVVWHVAHHLRLGVSVDDGYARLKPWIRHLHIQELPANYQAGQQAAYTRVGEGNGYLARVFELLERDGFQGYAANEWAASGNWRNADASRPEHYDAQHPDESLGNAARHLRRWRDEARANGGR
jgi:sugar phosphate isomerase/epimerase